MKTEPRTATPKSVTHGVGTTRAVETSLTVTVQTVRRLPIMARTANEMEDARDKCLTTGMVDYLSQSLNAEKVVKAIQQWLNP